MIQGRICVVTGAYSGIGRAIVHELVMRGAQKVAAVDQNDKVTEMESAIVMPFIGDATDSKFRTHVFDELTKIGIPSICVPCAGITRDSLAVKINKQTGEAEMYPADTFRLVLEVNLLAPTYWAMEMVSRIATNYGKWSPTNSLGLNLELRGGVVFIGSVSSQGNRGQVAYAASKKALEAVANTLTREAMFYGVKCGVVNPGFTQRRAEAPTCVSKFACRRS